jgi:hypothetical protein
MTIACVLNKLWASCATTAHHAWPCNGFSPAGMYNAQCMQATHLVGVHDLAEQLAEHQLRADHEPNLLLHAALQAFHISPAMLV